MTPEELWNREYQRWLARREKQRARNRWRYANEPEYAERVRRWDREYRAAHLDERRAYNREWMRRHRASSTPAKAPHVCVCHDCGQVMRRANTSVRATDAPV